MYIDMNKPIEYILSSYRQFLPGERHVSGVAKDDVLILVYDGVFRFTDNGEKVELRRGDYYFKVHGHTYDAPEPSDEPYFFHIHCLAGLTNDTWLPVSGTFDPTSMKYATDKLDEYEATDGMLALKMCIAYGIFTSLFNHRKTGTTPMAIRLYIVDHYTEKLTLESLADRFGYSRNRIVSLFRANYGITPIDYAIRLRLSRAKHLMRFTLLPLDEVAGQCGFSDYTVFYKHFVKFNGVSPAEWRKKNANAFSSLVEQE